MAQRVIEALISSADVQAIVESKTAQSEHTSFHQLSNSKGFVKLKRWKGRSGYLTPNRYERRAIELWHWAGA